MDRREFLKGTAWMGVVAAASGCMTRGSGCGTESGGSMALYADKPFKKLRVGVVGCARGLAGVRNFAVIPGCEVVAICDLSPSVIKRALDLLKDKGQKNPPKVYTGAEDESGLVGQLKVKLPSYMMPNRYVRLDRLPMTINDKIDRVTLKTTYIG